MKVYVYYNPLTQMPMYVGKGLKDRWKIHFDRSHNKTLAGKIRQLNNLGLTPFVSIWNVDNDEIACLIEQELIAKYGRLDNKTGILFNLTNGGDGVAGTILSVEHKMKISSALSGRKRPIEIGQKISASRKGIQYSEETKDKMSTAQKGKTRSDETRQRIAAFSKGSCFVTNGTEKKKIAQHQISEYLLNGYSFVNKRRKEKHETERTTEPKKGIILKCIH